MEPTYQIVTVDKPEESAWGIIGRGLGAYNKQQAGENHFQRLCFALQTPEQEIVGGVLAELYWGWLYIDLLWVREDLRDRGYGRQLMIRVEDEARQCGVKNAYLDTFSFQSPDFYAKLDYQVFGELQDFPPGQQRYFMKKQL